MRTLDAGTAEREGRVVPWLAMALVEGRPRRVLLRELGSLPEQLCRHVAHEIAAALEAIHDARVVHRDLTPENVLITPDHVVKVMDLGVALAHGEALRLSRTGEFSGTLLYSAPEQFEDEAGADPRSDLYALGLVLFELAAGRPPISTLNAARLVHRRLNEEPPRVGTLDPQISPFYEELVLSLIHI